MKLDSFCGNTLEFYILFVKRIIEKITGTKPCCCLILLSLVSRNRRSFTYFLKRFSGPCDFIELIMNIFCFLVDRVGHLWLGCRLWLVRGSH